MATQSRRSVHGLACRPCEFCGRVHTDPTGKTTNYQYIEESTGTWGKEVFCSRPCCSAWRTINGNVTVRPYTFNKPR